MIGDIDLPFGGGGRFLPTVPIAIQHAQKCSERPNQFAVLVRQDARNLVQVGQIVCSPRGKELGKRHCAKRWMPSAQLKLIWLQIKFSKNLETLRSNLGKFVEEIGKLPTLRDFDMSPAIEWLELLLLTASQDDPRTWNPIVLVGVYQVPDNIECRESAFAFITVRPIFRHPQQPPVKNSRSARQ